MDNFSILDQIISVEEMVRNYRAIFDKVKKSKRPMVVMRRSIPDVALVDVGWLRDAAEKLREIEEEKIMRIVKEGREEYKKGKTKVLKSIVSLMKSK